MNTLTSFWVNWAKRPPWLSVVLLVVVSAMGYLVYWLQPHGHRNLERLENLANRCTSPGASLVEVSNCFQSAGIEFTAYPKAEEEAMLYFDGRTTITAHKGDVPMSASTRSGATGPFPCGRTDVHIVLVFGPDEKLRDRLVKRFFTCP